MLIGDLFMERPPKIPLVGEDAGKKSNKAMPFTLLVTKKRRITQWKSAWSTSGKSDGSIPPPPIILVSSFLQLAIN